MLNIIDGYNVLHCGGFLGLKLGPGRLRNARGTLIGLLAKHMSPEERRRTIVVFDSRTTAAVSGDQHTAGGIHVRFADPHEEADDVIEELIRSHSVPRKLTVVSSDRRLKLAAKRRGATSIDSDSWLEKLTSRRPEPSSTAPVSTRDCKLDADQIQQWMAEMDLTELSDNIQGSPRGEPPENPFPPGYGEDLLEDSDQ